MISLGVSIVTILYLSGIGFLVILCLLTFLIPGRHMRVGPHSSTASTNHGSSDSRRPLLFLVWIPSDFALL